MKKRSLIRSKNVEDRRPSALTKMLKGMTEKPPVEDEKDAELRRNIEKQRKRIEEYETEAATRDSRNAGEMNAIRTHRRKDFQKRITKNRESYERSSLIREGNRDRQNNPTTKASRKAFSRALPSVSLIKRKTGSAFRGIGN